MAGLETIFGNVAQVGIMNFALGWLLFLALIYGLLHKSKIISAEISINAIISMIISFIIVNYTAIGLVLGDMFYILALGLVLMLVLLLVFAMMGVDISKLVSTGGGGTGGAIGGWAAMTIFGTVSAIMISYFGIINFNITIDTSTVITLAIIGIMALAVFSIGKAK